MAGALPHEQIHARSAILVAETATVIAESRELYRRAHILTRRALPMRGGSDAAPIVATITNTAMCLSCISKKSGVSTEEVNTALRSIVGTLRLSIGMRQCAVCMERKTTFAISADGNSSHGANGATRGAILSFLEEHRGTAFCSGCLSSRLFAGRDIDVTMRHLEGSGVIRRHGRCSACRLPRLVASVSSIDN